MADDKDAQIQELKAQLQAEKAKNKKERKKKNVSDYVKSNLALYNLILDEKSGVLSKFKNSSGELRYFGSRNKGSRQEKIIRLNQFFADLIDARLLMSDLPKEQINARRSMDHNSLITFFQKDRITRPRKK